MFNKMFSSFWKALAVFGLIIAAITVVSYVSIYVFGTISKDTADFRGDVEKHEQVEAQGEYRVAQHDYFYNLCSDIQAKQRNIKELEAAGYKEAATANEMQLNEMVSEYNSNASNNYSKGQFKADELPYQIDANKEVEECGKP